MSCPFGYGSATEGLPSNDVSPTTMNTFPANAAASISSEDAHADKTTKKGGIAEVAESKGASIVREEGAKLDYSSDMTYGDYLGLDRILTAQHPLSPAHDEMLFIIQHQTSELWMKLLLHEVKGATRLLAANAAASAAIHAEGGAPQTHGEGIIAPSPSESTDRPNAFKMLARVTRIMEQLVGAWTVLSTMTPTEYTAMRPFLASSSGFQSYQYRCIEFALGNKNDAMLKPHAHRPDLHAMVTEFFEGPSLYDVTLQLMKNAYGLDIPDTHTQRDWRKQYAASDAVTAAWLKVYSNPEQYWDLYQLGEKLCDIEDAFRLWRFRHLTTVERVIGFKRGTGGTGGVSYLKKMLDVVLFPELWQMRTRL